MKKRQLIVTGDRVLIQPDLREERTKVGLYLPQTVKDKEEVVGGTVVRTGPGIPLADPADMSDEPWKKQAGEIKFLPVQARAGDYVLYLQKAGVEIKYKNEKFVIIPQSAILLILRDDDEEDEPLFDTDLDPSDELPL